jgi:hypothetical protein
VSRVFTREEGGASRRSFSLRVDPARWGTQTGGEAEASDTDSCASTQ